jgi:hypothetical protein
VGWDQRALKVEEQVMQGVQLHQLEDLTGVCK